MKKEIKLGLFLIAVFIVFAYFIIKTESCGEFFTKNKRYAIYARFDTVAGLFTTAPVRLAGIKIGNVDEIFLEGRHAMVRMMIENRCRILDDARAVISTVGFVGEKYIEIVYKDELKSANPSAIKPGGGILVIEPFNFDEVKTKFDNIYERTIKITDSLNELMETSLLNLKSVSANLDSMLSENGKITQVFGNINQISTKLTNTIDMLNHFINEIDSAFTDNQKGIIKDLRDTTGKIDRLATDLTKISEDLRQGKGTAGKLLQDEALYKKIDDSVSSVQELLHGLEKSRNTVKAIAFNFAVHFDYFTRLKKTRSGLALGISSPSFMIMTGVNEDPLGGAPRFTALGGKTVKFVSLAAGLVESDLGAALRLNMWNKKLNLDLYAYGFTRPKYPILKTFIIFSLSKNINLSAGYYDLLKPNSREFMMGISFGN